MKVKGINKMESCYKNEADRSALWEALNEDKIDVYATDHAPHTLKKKNFHIQSLLRVGP